jgi:hypothetical protein
MRPVDAEALELIHRLIEDFAARLPAGPREEDVRQSLEGTRIALQEERGLEAAVRQLVTALHQLDESRIGGRRREYRRTAPAVGRLLEALQEELLPILRRSGYRL